MKEDPKFIRKMLIVTFVCGFPKLEDQVFFFQGASMFALDLRWLSDLTAVSAL